MLASTSSLYGDGNTLPYREDADTDRPLSPYAASKKAAEALCYTYHHLYGIDVTVFRYFTVYGPADVPTWSLSVGAVDQRGQPVTLYGDGTQSRDFTYVDDIARGTIAGLRPLGYEVINLGSDRPVNLLDFIALVEELVGRRATLEHRPRHPADVRPPGPISARRNGCWTGGPRSRCMPAWPKRWTGTTTSGGWACEVDTRG